MDILKSLTSGAFIVSLFVLCLFSASVLGVATGLTDGTTRLLETAVTLVLGYWLGSSAGSAKKDERIAALGEKL